MDDAGQKKYIKNVVIENNFLIITKTKEI